LLLALYHATEIYTGRMTLSGVNQPEQAGQKKMKIFFTQFTQVA